MAQEGYTAEEQALFDLEFEKQLRSELPNIREEEIKSAAQRAAQRELEQRRDELRDELDSEVAVTTSEDYSELREEANREAPSKLVIGLVLLILLLFLLAIAGQFPRFGIGRGNTATSAAGNQASGPLQAQLGGSAAATADLTAAGAGQTVGSQTGRGLPNAGGVDGLGSIPGIDPNINPLFAKYYVDNGGIRIFGLPIGPLETVNGRRIQWFERARLEYWPEYAGTPYEIQAGLVGSEYTDGRDFPKQAFFTNRPGLRFFAETSHGVGGKFLEFFDANGGLDRFGYPISDEIIEILPETKQYYTVQYFQRARMELHSELAGTQDEVQLGLLGRALYLNDAKSTPVPNVAPTPAPLP